MRILVGIPVLYNADLFMKSANSVLESEDVDLLIIDNGSDASCKEIIESYNGLYNVYIHVELTNVFVNGAWNIIMNYFLQHPEYDHLCIMNSDLILQEDWSSVLRNRWKEEPHELLLPVVVDKLLSVNTDIFSARVVNDGTPGIFITLSREQCVAVYPIPDDIRIWFGDNFIWGILRGLGYQTKIPPNFLATHAWSSTVSILPGAHEIIEQDKIAWIDKVESYCRYITHQRKLGFFMKELETKSPQEANSVLSEMAKDPIGYIKTYKCSN